LGITGQPTAGQATTRQAVILARGLGTRMRAGDPGARLTDAQRQAADSGHKAMMPIHGRPFLDYLLGAIAEAGVTRVALIVAPDHDEWRRYYEETARPSRIGVTFLVQPEARGTADAVLVTDSWTEGRPFLVMNADNLYPVAALKDLAALDEPGLPAFDADDLVRTSNIPPDRIASFALLDIDESGYLRQIVEKPVIGPRPSAIGHRPSVLGHRPSPIAPRPSAIGHRPSVIAISMNLWRFDARIFDACRDVPRSIRGEFELPEAVALALTRGVRFRAIPARGPVLDLSRRADAADVERRLSGAEARP
jgi:glucose-1-phosphate thymidylyltransferase